MADLSYLQWPFFDDAHRDLQTRLKQWCRVHLDQPDHSDIDAACRGLVTRLGDAGWLTHAAIDPDVPETPLDVRALCLIRETLAYHDALADFSFAMQGLGSGAVSLFGTEQQQAMLRHTRAGKLITAFALSERRSGSDVANIETSATRRRDNYVLSGEKTWISNGGIADLYTVFARTGEAPGARGLSAFLVPANIDGLETVERLETVSPHPLARLRFNEVELSPAAMIGSPGEGFRIAMSVLDVFRSTVGAAALGFARRAYDETLQRVLHRELFGGPMFDLQMVQGHLADMALSIDAAALLIYRAAWTRDRGAARVAREAAMAKLYATEEAQKVIDTAVQLHGGDGVRKGSVVEALYREIRALRIYEGASDVQRIIISRQSTERFKEGI